MNKISTSILGIKNEKQYNELIKTNPDYIHVDVMDGKFVNNYKDDYENILRLNKLPLDIHLMVVDPIKYIDKYNKYNPEYITIHIELDNVNSYIDYIKKHNIKVGIAINPSTKIEEVYPILPFIDMVLIMSVNPGYGGQAFIENSYNKITKLNDYINKNNYKVIISVDGGINNTNYKRIIESKSDILVIGSYITNSDNMMASMKKIRE